MTDRQDRFLTRWTPRPRGSPAFHNPSVGIQERFGPPWAERKMPPSPPVMPPPRQALPTSHRTYDCDMDGDRHRLSFHNPGETHRGDDLSRGHARRRVRSKKPRTSTRSRPIPSDRLSSYLESHAMHDRMVIQQGNLHAASRFQGVRRPLPEVPAFDSSSDNRKAPPRALTHESAQGRDSGIASRPFVVDNRKPPPVPPFDSGSDRMGDRTAIRRPPVPAFDDSNDDLVEEEIMDRRPPVPAFDDSRNQGKQDARASLPPVPAFHDSPRQGCPTNDHRKRPRADSHDDERNQKRRAVKAKSEEQNVIAPDIIDLTGEPDNFVEEPQSLPPLVHIIFAVDFSSSMKKKDVETSNGRISRWDAVFRCMDEFLTEQEQQEDNGACMSVLIFNNDAQALLNRMPLKDGKKVHDTLDTARNMHTPRGGTSFSAGFKLAVNRAVRRLRGVYHGWQECAQSFKIIRILHLRNTSCSETGKKEPSAQIGIPSTKNNIVAEQGGIAQNLSV